MNSIMEKLGPPRRAVMLLTVLAFAVRLALVCWMGIGTPPEPGSDGDEYDTYAWNVAQGRGYRGMSPDVADQDHLTAYRPPGPSLVFAALYRIFGRRYDVIRAANCVFGALSVIVAFAIGRRCYNDQIGVAAAAVCAVFPTALIFTVDISSEPLGNLFFLAFIWSCLQFADAPSWRNALLAGILFGMAIQMRANAIVMMPFLVIWVAWQFWGRWRVMLQTCLIPAIAIAAMVPWTVRNYLVFKKFIPLSTMGGSVLLQGNNDLVANVPELYGYNIWDTKIPEYREALQSAGDEVERDRRAKEFAVAWIKSHPEKWWYLFRMKIWRGMTPFLQPNSPRIYRWGMLIAWGPVLVLFVLAFIPTLVAFLRRGSPAWLIHLAILHVVLLSVIFFGLARYRQPIEPLCIILAVRAIAYLVERAGFKTHNFGEMIA